MCYDKLKNFKILRIGFPGEDGDLGPDGAKGRLGVHGPQGFRGENGRPGPAGQRGNLGLKGPNGPQGEKGEIGVTGCIF